MQRNGPLLALLPWVVGIAATGGASYWGYRELQQYRERTEQQLQQQRQAALSAQQEQEAQTRQLLAQLNPFLIAGTVVMTGLGGWIMVRGMRRDRERRQYEIAEAYRGF